jgi:hypothetical protein
MRRWSAGHVRKGGPHRACLTRTATAAARNVSRSEPSAQHYGTSPRADRDVSENKLTEVCPEIGQLQSLTRLDLHTNLLKGLPPSIGQLTRVKHL